MHIAVIGLNCAGKSDCLPMPASSFRRPLHTPQSSDVGLHVHHHLLREVFLPTFRPNPFRAQHGIGFRVFSSMAAQSHRVKTRVPSITSIPREDSRELARHEQGGLYTTHKSSV